MDWKTKHDELMDDFKAVQGDRDRYCMLAKNMKVLAQGYKVLADGYKADLEGVKAERDALRGKLERVRNQLGSYLHGMERRHVEDQWHEAQFDAALADVKPDPAPSAEPPAHVDSEYTGDHWATGECPRCKLEIALGARNDRAGGKTIEEHFRLRGWLPPDEVERRVQEARAEALEEAAQVADRLDDLLPMSSSIPDAIRALAKKPGEPKP